MVRKLKLQRAYNYADIVKFIAEYIIMRNTLEFVLEYITCAEYTCSLECCYPQNGPDTIFVSNKKNSNVDCLPRKRAHIKLQLGFSILFAFWPTTITNYCYRRYLATSVTNSPAYSPRQHRQPFQ